MLSGRCHHINNYPDILEGRVIDLQQTIKHVNRLAKQYGTRCAVWRYDPIVVTFEMTIAWHMDNFSKIARQLSGLVDEVIISFMQFYKKTYPLQI